MCCILVLYVSTQAWCLRKGLRCIHFVVCSCRCFHFTNLLFKYWGKELRSLTLAGLVSIWATVPSRGPWVIVVIQHYISLCCPVTSSARWGIITVGSLWCVFSQDPVLLCQSWVANHPQKTAHKLSALFAGCPLTRDRKIQSFSHWSLLCDGLSSAFPSRAHILIPDYSKRL